MIRLVQLRRPNANGQIGSVVISMLYSEHEYPNPATAELVLRKSYDLPSHHLIAVDRLTILESVEQGMEVFNIVGTNTEFLFKSVWYNKWLLRLILLNARLKKRHNKIKGKNNDIRLT